MPVRIQAYKCNWCNMTSMYKASVVRHEKNSCPRHRACGICANYSEQEETVYNNDHGGDPGSTDFEVIVMWCGASDSELSRKVSDCKNFKAKADIMPDR